MKTDKMKLDKEEAEILNAYDEGNMNLSTPSLAEIANVADVAKKTFRKNQRITIRLYDYDLKGIQKKAMEKGIPYQTLISSMIHQYIEGDLIENVANK